MKNLLVIALAICTSKLAFSQTPLMEAYVGQPNQIKLNLPTNVVGNSGKCNIDVIIPGMAIYGQEVEAPNFDFSININPQQIGDLTVKWEGKTKFRGLGTVMGCPGSGSFQIQVRNNNEQIARKWDEYFSKVSEEMRGCVKYGMNYENLKYQLASDSNTTLTSPDDVRMKPIYEKCDSFFSQNQPKKSVSCTFANQNNLKTICDGVYAEKQSDGVLRGISYLRAIQLHFEGKPWTIGLVENSEVKTNRLKMQEEERQRQASAAAAKLEAEEKERKWRESPEYKKQQAELERQRIAEAKAAEIAAKKQREEQEKIEKELERQRIAEAKAAEIAAKKQREEQEKIEKERLAAIEKEKREKAAQEKLKAENCLKATGMSVGAAEGIASTLRVSVSSVQLIRTTTFLGCEAVVDTPKGIYRCTAEVISKDGRVWVHFSPFLDCRRG